MFIFIFSSTRLFLLRLVPPSCTIYFLWACLSTWALPRTSNSADRRPAVSVRTGGGDWCFYLGPLMHLRLRRPTVSVCPGGGGGGVDTWHPSRTPHSAVSILSDGEGWCCDQVLLTHPQLRRGFRSAHESQPIPRIPT